jgi:hypothetical protein
MPSPFPSPCPSVYANGGGPPNPGTAVSGVVFANFSLDVKATTTVSGFFFPQVNGLLVDNVCMIAGSGAAKNVFDFGERLANSFSNIVIRDSTCETNFGGHYIALHGGGDGLTVERNYVRGNGGLGNAGGPLLNLFFDTTDMVGGTASHLSFRYNDFEGPFLGMFSFLPRPTTFGGSPSQIVDAEWVGNIYDQCAFFCYYFGAEASQTPAPSFSNVRLADRWAISSYDSIYLDGGFYRALGTGVQGLKIGGPSLYGGSDANGSGASVFLITTAPGSSGSLVGAVGVQLPGAGPTPLVISYAAGSGDSVSDVAKSLAARLGAGVGTDHPLTAAFSPTLANRNYGVIAMQPLPAIGPGSYTAEPYMIITTGNSLRPLNWASPFPTCPVPASLVGPGAITPAPCMTGSFDIGDGLSMRNGVHNLDANGARIQSIGGASIHMWPNGGDAIRALYNVLGHNSTASSYTAIQLDPGTQNPVNFLFGENDLVGAAGSAIVAPLPTPSFASDGSAPVMRNNRGATTQILGPTIASASGPLFILLNIENAGPLDCIYYFTNWSGSISTTNLTLAGTATTVLPNAEPASLFLPVGATLLTQGTSGSSVTYVAFCQP